MKYIAFDNDDEMQMKFHIPINKHNSIYFLSFIWYMFSFKAYIYMIQCFKGKIIPTGNMIVDVDSLFINLDWATDIMNNKKNLKKLYICLY